MKKILIATTALVATAGVAAADVTISGYARFGAVYDDLTEDVNTASRLRLQFDVTTETDAGLTLGARMRMQAEENLTGGWNGARFYGSYGGVTVAVGNIIGVIEAAPNLYLPTKSAGVGLEGNAFTHLAPNTVSNGNSGFTAYSSGGAGATNGVEIMYNANGLGLHVHSTRVDGGNESYGLGANYTFGDYVAAVAYEEWTSGARDGDSILFASIGGKWDAFDAALSYADTDLNGIGAEKWSLRAGYTVNNLYVYGFVADENNGIDESYGLGVSYGLGGGASIEAGWEYRPSRDAIGTQTALDDAHIVSAGIFFSF